MKHFYETGEFVHFDWDYTDSQTEGVLWDIMIAWGADLQTGGDVLSRKIKFDFSKYTAPTNSKIRNYEYYEERGFDNYFKDYYESHGFEYPF